MGKFREKIEGWLAPENVRNGVPTYIPRQKLNPVRPPAPEFIDNEGEQSAGEEQPVAGESRAFHAQQVGGVALGLARSVWNYQGKGVMAAGINNLAYRQPQVSPSPEN